MGRRLSLLAALALIAGCAASTPPPEDAAYYKAKWEACEKRYLLMIDATKMYRDEVLKLQEDCR